MKHNYSALSIASQSMSSLIKGRSLYAVESYVRLLQNAVFRMKLVILISFLSWGLASRAQNLLPSAWKFKTGDNPTWSKPGLDDSAWGSISPDKVWEQQGFPSFDGFAWYRATFVIPASSRQLVRKNGGFLLNLGKIDDADITYFNGEIIGQTGGMPPDFKSAYNYDRSYRISNSLIRWGKPNTIAVRVYDETGNGGIYSGPPMISIKGLFENISLYPSLSPADRIFKGSADIPLPISIDNMTGSPVTGQLSLKVFDDLGSEIRSLSKDVTILKKSSSLFEFRLTDVKPGFYKVRVKIESGMFSKLITFNFGFEPEKVVVKPDRQPDFESFWAQAKADLKQVDPQFRMIKIDTLCTSAKDIYLVEMHSLGNVLIRGWYSIPKAPGKYPAIMQVPGYSSTIVPSYINYGDDIIGFGLNIRGHGNSRDDVNPGFPGYLLYHLDNVNEYIYRGAYMDCVRAVDFLFSRPEVDTSRVVVEGASQGGALTFATAALNNTRIILCAPQVPFLSDFPHYFKVASWPANEFASYVEMDKKQTWEEVYRTLSYFDIKNLAPWIKAPMIMGSGLCDEVCPSVINFAAYNNVPGEKTYVVYPLAGHNLPNEYYTLKMKWIREKLGLKQP